MQYPTNSRRRSPFLNVSVCAIALAFLFLPQAPQAFEGFNSESAAIDAAVTCHAENLTEGGGPWGDLFACLGGVHETVKVFVNEEPGTGRVENVKIMWNDYTRDVGQGVHTGASIARAWVAALAVRYAPRQVEAVTNAFFSNRNRIITSQRYRIEYTHSEGPAIDERLLVVTAR